VHTLCMLNNLGYKHILRICNTYCFSMAKMVVKMHLNVTFTHKLPVLFIYVQHKCHAQIVFSHHLPDDVSTGWVPIGLLPHFFKVGSLPCNKQYYTEIRNWYIYIQTTSHLLFHYIQYKPTKCTFSKLVF